MAGRRVSDLKPYGVSIWKAVKELYANLRRTIWTLQLGTLLVILGLMASTVPTIFSFPLDLSHPEPKNIPAITQLFGLMQVCTVELVVILIAMAINLFRLWLIWMRNADDKISLSDRATDLALSVFCLMTPYAIIWDGLRSVSKLNFFLRDYLKIPQKPIKNPAWDLLVAVTMWGVHNPIPTAIGALVIWLNLEAARIYVRDRKTNNIQQSVT